MSDDDKKFSDEQVRRMKDQGMKPDMGSALAPLPKDGREARALARRMAGEKPKDEMRFQCRSCGQDKTLKFDPDEIEDVLLERPMGELEPLKQRRRTGKRVDHQRILCDLNASRDVSYRTARVVGDHEVIAGELDRVDAVQALLGHDALDYPLLERQTVGLVH